MNTKYANVLTDFDNVQFAGIGNIPVFPINVFKTYTIPIEENFRPDKISSTLYNENPNNDWILIEVNNFKHPFKDFYAGRTIQYISEEDLLRLGL